MNNGLFDPRIVSFVFAPLVVTIALWLAFWWKRMRNNRVGLDAPGLLLASAVRAMSDEQREWGVAMLAELSQIHEWTARWRFALGGVRVALLPPRREGRLQPVSADSSPICGMLAVALPPLGLPFIYFVTVIVEAIGGSPLTLSSRWTNPAAVMAFVNIALKLTLGCLVAGLPLGLVGWLRRERLRKLSVLGMLSSLCIFGYFLLVMHFVAGGPNGD